MYNERSALHAPAVVESQLATGMATGHWALGFLSESIALPIVALK